jgi:hypothetical protein
MGVIEPGACGTPVILEDDDCEARVALQILDRSASASVPTTCVGCPDTA